MVKIFLTNIITACRADCTRSDSNKIGLGHAFKCIS